jgi:hypothetical protein
MLDSQRSPTVHICACVVTSATCTILQHKVVAWRPQQNAKPLETGQKPATSVNAMLTSTSTISHPCNHISLCTALIKAEADLINAVESCFF